MYKTKANCEKYLALLLGCIHLIYKYSRPEQKKSIEENS